MSNFLVVATILSEKTVLYNPENGPIQPSVDAALEVINEDRAIEQNDAVVYTVYEVVGTFNYTPPKDKGVLTRA